jgi:hypothetical protein
LTGHPGESFEASSLEPCPPVTGYSSEFQVCALEKLAILQQEFTVIAIMSDHADSRQQVFSCSALSRDILLSLELTEVIYRSTIGCCVPEKEMRRNFFAR